MVLTPFLCSELGTQVLDSDSAAAVEMEIEGAGAGVKEKEGKVSTHGPRGSRKEEWRKAKGLPSANRSRLVMMGAKKAGKASRRR